jgi:hypothetical protein
MVNAKMLLVLATRGLVSDTLGYVHFWTRIGIFWLSTSRPRAVEAQQQALAVAFATHNIVALKALFCFYCIACWVRFRSGSESD